jgi:hypothetical protein
MPRVMSFLAWFAALELLWLLLVGTTQGTEVLAGLAAAAVGAAFAEVLRAQGLLGFARDRRLAVKALRLPWLVVFDFGLLTWVLLHALAGRRRVRGAWVTVPFPTEAGSVGRWQRAVAVATSNGAANAVVVDLRDDEALLHALRPDLFTGRQVL